MNSPRFLCLGAGDGWHRKQLQQAASKRDCELVFSDYQSLQAHVDATGNCTLDSDAGSLDSVDAILTRTMPAGSFEQLTFRLAILHSIADGHDPIPIVNPPRALEIAIDKFAALARVAQLGFDVPETSVVQSRREALEAFHRLGGDCVVKPIFGGEGRGIMRVRDAELAWTVFSTLQQLDAVAYVQRFVPPGGRDTRLIVVGDDVLGLRRENHSDFRTNKVSGATTKSHQPAESMVAMAQRICGELGLSIAAVDLIDSDDGPKIIEVNAIPGWQAAQRVTEPDIAGLIIQLLLSSSMQR